MALEVKLGQDLRLRQQLVMTPQLQQAIKILQLSLPELEAVVQAELEQNPMLEPLDQSPAESAAESEAQTGEAPEAADAEPGAPSDNGAEPPEDGPTWDGMDGVPEKTADAGARGQGRRDRAQGARHARQARLARVPGELLQQLAGRRARAGARRRAPADAREHADPQDLARRPSDVAAAAVEPFRGRPADRRRPSSTT